MIVLDYDRSIHVTCPWCTEGCDICSNSGLIDGVLELMILLETMKYPSVYRCDLTWLFQNLGKENFAHPHYKQIMSILSDLIYKLVNEEKEGS